MTTETIEAVRKAAEADLKEMGFVGMDYNMAVICICSKKTGAPVRFAKGGEPHDNKREYWASRRVFCHLQLPSEDAILEHAAKEYKIKDDCQESFLNEQAHQ